MATDMVDLKVFQLAEKLADGVWRLVLPWNAFAKNTVGEQVVRAADRVGATIAEAHGRFHFGDKLQFLYYARGSLYETRFWLRQAYKRELMIKQQTAEFAELLEPMAKSINSFASSLRVQRSEQALKESSAPYEEAKPISSQPISTLIFTEEEIKWLTNLTDENAF